MPYQRTTEPRRVSATIRRTYAVELRAAGKGYRAIAAEMITKFGKDRLPKGYDERYAWMDVRDSLVAIRTEQAEKAEEVLALEELRLDAMLEGIYADAIAGDKAAIDRVLKIGERRAALLGLNAPVKVAPTDPSGQKSYDEMTDEQRKQRILEIVNAAQQRKDTPPPS